MESIRRRPVQESEPEECTDIVSADESGESSKRRNVFKHQDLHPKLFSVFSKQRKIVHLIRHGHTTYTEGYFRTRSGNHPFDVILSPLGIQQASGLKEKVKSIGAEVIITSPLTRALQTLQYAMDFIEESQRSRIKVLQLHSEHVHGTVDVGRPASILAKEFPMLSFAELDEVWWFSPKRTPNDPIQGIFGSRESMDHLRKRVGIFRKYLLSRPETTIVVIGHSTFFKVFSGRRKRMENCEVLTMKI